MEGRLDVGDIFTIRTNLGSATFRVTEEGVEKLATDNEIFTSKILKVGDSISTPYGQATIIQFLDDDRGVRILVRTSLKSEHWFQVRWRENVNDKR